MRKLIFILVLFFSNYIFAKDLPTPFKIKFDQNWSSQKIQLEQYMKNDETIFNDVKDGLHKMVHLDKDPSPLKMDHIYISVIDDKIYQIQGSKNYASYKERNMLIDRLYKKYSFRNQFGINIINTEDLIEILRGPPEITEFVQHSYSKDIKIKFTIRKFQIFLSYYHHEAASVLKKLQIEKIKSDKLEMDDSL